MRRRRDTHRLSSASADDLVESPVYGKQIRHTRSPADTEYHDITANSRSSGATIPDGKQHQDSLCENPVILASRIPIDRINLGAVIGHGGFGEVYRGRYRDQDVAIKTLLPDKRKDLKHIQAFLSEVLLMATMDHPHIVQFIGVAWESLSDLFCVTELMTGGDLRSLLKDYHDNRFPQGMNSDKMRIAYQVAFALTYLHSMDPVVLHRDLKSRNILLTNNLDAKITDFGASRVRSDVTMTAGVGSSLWMAPEVMMGMRYGEKADVFSLGVVISELDTHELPYSHAKESSSGHPLPDTAVLQMVSLGKLRVQFSPFMAPDLARFVDSCLNIDPRLRPTAAEVLYFLQVASRQLKY
ncbi:tkl protein kinase [Plasmopara halstedii]|uniref:Tkl protein kinase n=1 Tax=Plasmopara halstedii TaxID=4781 RepID=A0A0P1AEZ5_PLAHL|nr:tkl protein kinase [Plasmopara halstedii]CEG39383.1 tkl protein kinase [Plasmopara halstedii]|eukprot:XP_024575752.1 tkl protein kinase [Plasmopara halstedii]